MGLQPAEYVRMLRKISDVNKNEGLGGLIDRARRLPRNNYRRWVRMFDTLSRSDQELMAEKINQIEYQPLISVIMPVCDPPPAYLSNAIESVIRQIYPHWELCIADDASANPKVPEILHAYSIRDSRIKVVYRKERGNISACSNTALHEAIGDWIALLDHDDELSPDALYHAVRMINLHPDTQMIYSDEDKLTMQGERTEPYFKSDWNRDLFYSQNMYSHLGMFRTSLVRSVGGFREGYEGSQDYDLTLRCLGQVGDRQIKHIPKVLYHWRIHDQSAAQSAKNKPMADMAGQQALTEHFSLTGINAQVESTGFGYRVRYSIPTPEPLVTIIIPFRDQSMLLKKCLESIFGKTLYQNFDIRLVDNGSTLSETREFLREILQKYPRLSIIRDDGPFNFSRLINLGVSHAGEGLVCLLNNDIEIITPDWLGELVSTAIQPGVGPAGAKLLYPDGRIQHAGIILGLGRDRIAGCAGNKLHGNNKGHFGRTALQGSFSAVTAACLVVRRDLFQMAGGFNEHALPVAYNDVDFCLRLGEKGFRSVMNPCVKLIHHESYSRNVFPAFQEDEETRKSVDYMRQTWGDLLLNDPFYNPNLTLDYSDFSLAWPPANALILKKE